MFIPAEIRRVILGGGESRLLCLDAAAPGEALDEYRGQAQAVYLDPPFMTGGQLLRQRPFGEEGWRSDKPGLSYPGYSDRFASRDAYLSLLRGLLETGRGLLTDSGVLALHLDWRASAYARVLGDELFGEDCFINEVIWGYDSGGRSRRSFSRKHDTILFWGKTKDWRFRIDRVPVLRVRKKRSHLRRGVDEATAPSRWAAGSTAIMTTIPPTPAMCGRISATCSSATRSATATRPRSPCACSSAC